jgi:hypothetical protein
VSLENLQISAEALETYTEMDVATTLSVQWYQFRVTRNFQKLLSLLFTECLFVLFILIFLVPVSLMILRAMGTLPNDPRGIQLLFFFFASLTALGLGVINFFLGRNQRKIKPLAMLLLEIEKYNRIVQSLTILNSLDATRGQSNSPLQKHADVLEILQTTRQSLVDALQVERILRCHHQLLAEGYELMANLDTAFATLTAVEIRDRASEYGQVLNEALSIGLTVHREVRKLYHLQH